MLDQYVNDKNKHKLIKDYNTTFIWRNINEIKKNINEFIYKKISKIISDTVIKTQTFGISYGFYTLLWYVGWYIYPISKLRQFAEEKKMHLLRNISKTLLWIDKEIRDKEVGRKEFS